MSFHASYFWLSVLSGGRNARSPSRSSSCGAAAEVDHEGSLCCHVEVIAKDDDDDDGDDGNAITFVSGGDG